MVPMYGKTFPPKPQSHPAQQADKQASCSTDSSSAGSWQFKAGEEGIWQHQLSEVQQWQEASGQTSGEVEQGLLNTQRWRIMVAEGEESDFCTMMINWTF